MRTIGNLLRVAGLAMSVSLVPAAVIADGGESAETISDLKKQIKALADKVSALEKKEEVSAKAEEKAQLNEPLITADEKGLSVQSADKKFSFRLKGLLQFDSRWYFDDGSPTNDTFVLRRARPIFEGTLYDNYEFKFVPDFGGGSVVIQDAYMNVNYYKEFQIQAGKYKTPVGLELLQSDASMAFIERGLPTNLVPNRDLGVMFHGEPLDGIIAYQAGVFGGLADGRSTTNVDIEDDKDFVGRLFVQPFKNEKGFLQGLGFGMGSSIGRRSGQANGLTAGYLTDGQQTFFSYNTPGAASNAIPIVTADGWTYRLAPQAYYYYRSFGLLGEWTLSSTDARVTGAGTNIRNDRYVNTAWQIEGNWVLTGEDASFKGVKPKKNFSLQDGTFGAVELVARYGELNIDGDAFASSPGSTGAVIGPAATSGSAMDDQAWGVGVNWYLNPNVRVSLDYFQSSFFGGDGSNLVVKNGEQAVLTRFQVNF